MSQIKVLYVRNLTLEMTNYSIWEMFEKFGPLERVKKIKDYAFVHFEHRHCAIEAMKQMNGYLIMPEGLKLEISLAKPPTDKRRKEEILRNREKRMMVNMMMRNWYFFFLFFLSNNNHFLFNSNNNNQPNDNYNNNIPNNHPGALQAMTFIQPTTIPIGTNGSAPILLNSCSTLPSIVVETCLASSSTSKSTESTLNPTLPLTIPTTSAHHLTTATCIPNGYLVGYSPPTSHNNNHHHYTLYQPSLPRSTVARVTLSSPNNENISTPEHRPTILNGHHFKSEMLDIYNQRRNYSIYDNCAWCAESTLSTSSSLSSIHQSNYYPLIPPTIDQSFYGKMNPNNDYGQPSSSTITSSILTNDNDFIKAPKNTTKSNK